MSVEVKVPNLPESVSEATVAAWHKKPGEKVGRDENVVDLETDKVMLEVPAASAGVLEKILKDEGETVSSGDVIGILAIDEEAQDGAAKESGDGDSEAATEGKSKKEDEKEAAGEPEKARSEPARGAKDDDADKDAEAPPLSPAVRRLVTENNLDPENIPASGKGGRLVKSDVVEYLERGEAESQKSRSEPREPEAPPKKADEALPSVSSDGRIEERVPMTRIRARIAERLVEVQRTAAILTTFNDVDLKAVNDLRERHKARFEKDNDIRLGFMSFFVKAAVEALKRFPIVNASIDGSDIVYHGYYDIGIAVSSPRGLVVPILRDVDALGFADIERQIREYGRKARDNKLTMDDLQGGTFSITNGGVFGSMLSTPILNPPQSAILGMHGIQERPVVVDGEIVIRPMMYLALSYDHRIVDGRESVQFLRTIKEMLEDPSRMLLQI